MIAYILLAIAVLTSLYLYNSKWKRDRDLNYLKDLNNKLEKELKYFREFSEFLDPLYLRKKEFDKMKAEELFRRTA
jgi:uncharacterized protein YihD (DUF1040 family)